MARLTGSLAPEPLGVTMPTTRKGALLQRARRHACRGRHTLCGLDVYVPPFGILLYPATREQVLQVNCARCRALLFSQELPP